MPLPLSMRLWITSFHTALPRFHAAKEIVHRMVHVSARDALHLAVMNSARISRILSFDRGFDAHPGIERLS